MASVATPDPVPVSIIINEPKDAEAQPVTMTTSEAPDSVASLDSQDSSIQSQINTDVLVENDLKLNEVEVESTNGEPRTVADIGRTGSLQELTSRVTSQGATTIVVMQQPVQAASSTTNQTIQLS